MKILLIFLVLIGCTHQKPDPSEPGENFDPKPLYDYYVDRLDDFQEDGWIVSRKEDGSPEHQGDSLLWTGLAIGSLPCDEASDYAERMQDMIKENGGALVRFQPLGEYENGREISFDGATGLYYGILSHLLACNSVGDWDLVWPIHTDYLSRNYGYLHPNVRVAVEPEFTVLPDMISHLLGRRGRPDSDRIRALEAEATAWVYAVKVAKEPCFRIHLSWLYMKALEKTKELSARGKHLWCVASEGTDIPLVDHWCGRYPISDWKFTENEWEYRHQRCGGWETPDGDGIKTPGLDLIISYKEVLDSE